MSERKPKGETTLQGAIVNALQLMGCHVMRLNSGGRRGRIQLLPKGTPDLLVLIGRARFFWCEIKSGKGEPSAEQLAWHAAASQRGETVVVARDVVDAVNAVSVARQEGRLP